MSRHAYNPACHCWRCAKRTRRELETTHSPMTIAAFARAIVAGPKVAEAPFALTPPTNHAAGAAQLRLGGLK